MSDEPKKLRKLFFTYYFKVSDSSKNGLEVCCLKLNPKVEYHYKKIIFTILMRK